VNDTATGILNPSIDRERPVEQRKPVEIEFHAVATRLEIMNLADLGHRAVAV